MWVQEPWCRNTYILNVVIPVTWSSKCLWLVPTSPGTSKARQIQYNLPAESASGIRICALVIDIGTPDLS